MPEHTEAADEKIRPIEDVGKWDRHTCQQQMYLREKLIEQMVGSLYPAIVAGEIGKIQGRIDRIVTDG